MTILTVKNFTNVAQRFIWVMSLGQKFIKI
jgi:hypothetical protein